MDALQLETILKEAYRSARGRHKAIHQTHASKGERVFHSALSDAWVAGLADALQCHERAECADEVRDQVKVFHRQNHEHRTEFLLNEFLHDICVARTDYTGAARHNTCVPVMKRVLWQVESEFNSDTREAAKDFNKLIAGRADRKLFVGPYNGHSPQASSAACAYRNVLREIRNAAEQGCEEEWFLGLVPHPSRWKLDDSEAVQVWRFEFESSDADWVRP